ncbi:MAG: hypothetical protein AAF961_06635, partial [Planctomycetota bacterium]
MNNRKLYCAAPLWMLMAAAPATVHAQAVDLPWIRAAGDDGSWNEDANWEGNLIPSADFSERGVINNGGVATLSELIQFDVGGVLLGGAAGESGTLRVLSGGDMI